MKTLPIDIQTFAEVREKNHAYVDKTGMISELLHMGKYFFLSRPRRFGKSLFVTTLKSFFEGKKELFTGLAIENQSDWQPCPVIFLDFSMLEFDTDKNLWRTLKEAIGNQAVGNQISIPFDEDDGPGTAFQKTVIALWEKTGRPVVLLVDEYDSPITHWLKQPDLAEANREVLRSFFSSVKGMDAQLKFVFITGVSKFANVSVFSSLSNMNDITLLPRFNQIVGFTETEIESNFSEHLDHLAEMLKMSPTEIREEIRRRYNGYNWTGKERVYNPFSVMRALYFEKLGDYWFVSGTPTFLIKELRKREMSPQDFENIRMTENSLDTAEIKQLPIEAVLFQTGYLTISKSEWEEGYWIHTLNFPNSEVKDAFLSHLLPEFAGTNPAKTIPDAIDLRRYLSEGNTKAAGDILLRYIANIPGKLHISKEKYYQSIFYMALSLAGMKVDLEKWVSTGILDGVLELKDKVFIIEFKYARIGSADTLAKNAIEQIKNKDYSLAWTGVGKSLHAFGIGVAGRKAGFLVEPLG